MKGEIWLVVLVHVVDDYSIRGFPDVVEAYTFIVDNPILVGPEHGPQGWYAGPVVQRAYLLAGAEASTPLGYKIWHFVDGVPVGCIFASWLRSGKG